jgi:hypothetical protein
MKSLLGMPDRAIEKQKEQKAAFLSTLEGTQEQLRDAGINYRIIGSLATHAHLGNRSSVSIPPLDYNRPGAATADQSIPDIDIIVPRVDLPAARQIRQDVLDTEFPVKIGLAVPTTEIDFLPDESASFLTHKNLRVPVSTELFHAEMVSLDGVDIQTIPLDTLFHTYGTFGGMIRHKDLPLLRELAKNNPESSEDTQQFHTYQRARRSASPGEYRFGRAVEAFNERVSPRVRNEFFKYALKAADILGKR